MAIAFNTALTGYVGSATSKTLTIAPSSTANLLVAFVMTTNSSRTISSITWAGGSDFSSTKVGPATVGSFKQYAAYLAAPTTGSNNLVVTIDAASEIYCAGLFYDGAKQTGIFDNSALNTSSLVQPITTVADNCWTVCSGLADGGSLASSTNSTTRSTILNTAWGVFDSNGPVTPAGSFTMTQTGSGSKGGVIVSISPGVAYSTSTDGGYTSSGTTRTFSHTTSGTENYTLVGSWTRSSGANAVTGITYNGVAMTALGTEVTPNNSSGAEYIRFWGIAVGTGVGAANVVISCPTGMESIVFAVSYTGASQTGQPDASSNQSQTTQTNTTATVTTVADNSYAVVLARNQAGSGSAGTNATFRTYGLSSSGTGCFDRGTLSPAGSYSLTVNHSSNKAGYQMVSIKPPGGSSTQIFSINGVAQASISSFNGVALASIASASGVANS